MAIKKPFEFLEHTADVLVRAYGATIEEALANVALGMFEIMTDTSRVEPKIAVDVRVCGYDLENLVYRWLEELLYYHDVHGYVFSKFEITPLSEDIVEGDKMICINARVYGEVFDRDKHEPRTVVKAVTYHNMRIQKHDHEWSIDVVFDI